LDRLAKGVTIDGMEYGPIEASLDRVQGDNVWLTLGLREGKNREVKRILEHLGLSVNRLIRLSFGPFQLGDLEVGLAEEVPIRVPRRRALRNAAASGSARSAPASVGSSSSVFRRHRSMLRPPKSSGAATPTTDRQSARSVVRAVARDGMRVRPASAVSRPA